MIHLPVVIANAPVVRQSVYDVLAAYVLVYFQKSAKTHLLLHSFQLST